jgi:hypothetical protein
MKKYFTQLRLLVLVTAVLVLFSVSPAWAQTIQLTIGTDGGNTILQTSSNHCPSSPDENGCIKVARGSAATIHFVLPANQRCGPAEAQGHWAISGVQLAMQDKAWGAQPLPAYVASDFDADASSGWINGVVSSASISITDENTRAYDVWYRVQASCTRTGVNPIYLDPRVRNTGRD